MRLSELLGAEVLDEHGGHAGRVHDLRLVREGPPLGTFGAALQVQGLLVGKQSLGTRLGYGRTSMHGPALVRAVVRWLHREGRFVPWERVEAVEPGRITISGSVRDLPHPEPG